MYGQNGGPDPEHEQLTEEQWPPDGFDQLSLAINPVPLQSRASEPGQTCWEAYICFTSMFLLGIWEHNQYSDIQGRNNCLMNYLWQMLNLKPVSRTPYSFSPLQPTQDHFQQYEVVKSRGIEQLRQPSAVKFPLYCVWYHSVTRKSNLLDYAGY